MTVDEEIDRLNQKIKFLNKLKVKYPKLHICIGDNGEYIYYNSPKEKEEELEPSSQITR